MYLDVATSRNVQEPHGEALHQGDLVDRDPPAPPGYVFIPSVSVQKDGTNSLLPHKLTRGQTLQRALICLAIEETRKKPPLTAACAYPWATWWAHQSFPSAARAS